MARDGAPQGVHTQDGGAPRWVEPTLALRQGAPSVLTPAQVQQWKEQRFVVVDGIWPADLIADAVRAHTGFVPPISPDNPAAELVRGKDFRGRQTGFGAGNREQEFPFDSKELDAFNQLTLHPRALQAVAQLLGTNDLRVTRSNFGAKIGALGHEKPRTSFRTGFGEVGDQPMHLDFRNNMLLVPSAHRPDTVAGILYLNNVEDAGGATGIVPYEPGSVLDRLPLELGESETGWGRTGTYEGREIYERELLPRYRVGTCLLYRMDTYHRGTPVFKDTMRRVWGAVWRRGDSGWVQAGGAGMHGDATLARFAPLLPRLTPAQRAAVGFPLPGNAYWTAETVAAVGERYQGMDMSPYLEGIDDELLAKL